MRSVIKSAVSESGIEAGSPSATGILKASRQAEYTKARTPSQIIPFLSFSNQHTLASPLATAKTIPYRRIAFHTHTINKGAGELHIANTYTVASRLDFLSRCQQRTSLNFSTPTTCCS